MSRSIRSLRSFTLCILVGVAASCGGTQPAAQTAAEPPTEAPAPPAAIPEPAPPAESTAAPAASGSAAPAAPASAQPAAAPAPVDFDGKSDDEKKEYMKTVVLPHMKAQFAQLDAKKYAKMNCPTCHGPGAKKGKFDMPNPGLPKLDPTNGFAKHKKKTPKTVQFMMEHVVPEMAKLLGMKPYNPETKQGFGCFDCHTKQGS